MKKSLLLVAASMTVAGLSAQSMVSGQKVQMAQKQQLPAGTTVNFSSQAEVMQKVNKNSVMHPKTAMFMNAEAGSTAPRRAYTDGVYYKQPAGTMYQCWGEEGRGFGVDVLRFPAYTDVLFVDESANPSRSRWSLGENDYTSELLQEDGRTALWSQSPLLEDEESFWSTPCLTLTNVRKTYTLGQEGRYYQNYGATRMASTVKISPMSMVCDHNTEGGYYGWSSFNDKHYIFGSGSATIDGTNVTFIGVQQSFPAPISPLYVESAFLPFYSFSENDAIPAGKSLSLQIYKGDSDEPYVVMEATAEDVTYYTNEDGSKDFIDDDEYGKLYMGSIHFAIKGVDAFGTPTEEPFVIDSDFTVAIFGFDEVEVGMGAYKNYAPDELEASYILFDNGKGTSYQTPFNFQLTFNSLFDIVYNRGDVEANDGNSYPSYYVGIEDDGASSHNYIFSDLDGALIFTGTPWFSEDGDENYGAYELPDWITSVEVSLYQEPSEGEIESAYCVNFTAEPLPNDVKGRGYFVYLQGRGVYSQLPIFAFQGDPETAWDDAVANENDPNASAIKVITMVGEKKAAPMVNLFGQQVSDSFKGIVVVDGKKQIRY